MTVNRLNSMRKSTDSANTPFVRAVADNARADYSRYHCIAQRANGPSRLQSERTPLQ